MRLILAVSTAIFTVLFSSILPGAAHAAAEWEKQTVADYRLPDPPDEQQSLLEIEVLLKLQDERTDVECKLGQMQRTPSFQNLFSGTPLLSAKEIKSLSPLMKRVGKLGEKISQSFKSRYMRTRPYDVDSRLQPCVTPPGGQKSYPSSHATISTLDACVLATIFTDKKMQLGFRDLATQLSERRMKVGVHFPSDVKAGENLGMAICRTLANDPEFMTEVEEVRLAL